MRLVMGILLMLELIIRQKSKKNTLLDRPGEISRPNNSTQHFNEELEASVTWSPIRHRSFPHLLGF